MGPTTHQGVPRASGAPWCLVGPMGLLWCTSGLPGSLLGRKNSPKNFAAFGLRLVLIFYEVKNKQKIATGTGH